MEQVRVGLTTTEDVPDGNLNAQVKADGTFVLSNVDSRNQPFAGATCVLIPAAARQNRLDLDRTASTDQFGRFTFTGIAQGDYRVFAWEDIPQGAYQDPAYVSRFEDRGRPIRIEKGGAASVQVNVIPANAN